jgi:CrcB protein
VTIDLLWIAIAAGLGSLVRFHLGAFVHRVGDRFGGSEQRFPIGTLAVNTLGCLVAGVVAGLAARGVTDARLVVIALVGFCGSLTTFSTLAYDLERALREKRVGVAIANLLLSVGLGLGAAWVGLRMGGA